MEIRQFVWDVVDSNSWLITEGNNGLLVDAVDSETLYDEILVLDHLTIILTHSHFDHICGLNQIRSLRPDCTVISTEKCSDNVGNVKRNMSAVADAFLSFYDDGRKEGIRIAPFICGKSDHFFNKDYCFDWFGHRVELIPVYGHSDDGSLVLIDNKHLFTGDTLLHVPTATRFPRGSTKRFYEEDILILKRFGSIDNVYPGHGNTGRIDEMIIKNNEKI